MTASLFDERPAERPPITLRPYQQECVEAVRQQRESGVNRTLAVLATGLGKTTIFSEVARQEAERGGRTVVLAHRDELIDQATRRLRDQAGLQAYAEVGSTKAPSWAQVVVASVATVGRKNTDRLRWFKPTLVVTDEAHHSAADTYVQYYNDLGVFDGQCDHLGVTATAHRMDNRPLHGDHAKAIFETVAYDYGIVKGICDGWLVDVVAYRVKAGYDLSGVKTTAGDYNQAQLAEVVDREAENLQAFRHWKDVAAGRKTIVFCASVEHALHMAEVFAEHGVPSEAVHGKMTDDQRRAVMARFQCGETLVLTNCNIATEGFDVPDVSCVLLVRPTQSWSLFVQMIGRGLRVLPGVVENLATASLRISAINASRKPDCVVIDVVGTSDGKSPASVPEILGLPKGYEGKGESMRKTINAVEELPDWIKARLSQRAFDLDSLPGVLKKIDLLAELKPPVDVTQNSRLAWMPVTEGYYVLSMGADREKINTGRSATLKQDTLGAWRLTVKSDQQVFYDAFPLGDVTLAEAFRMADSYVQDAFPGIASLMSHNAAWRSRTQKSEKQLFWLKRFGLSQQEIDSMDAGQVSAFLDKKFAERRKG